MGAHPHRKALRLSLGPLHACRHLQPHASRWQTKEALQGR